MIIVTACCRGVAPWVAGRSAKKNFAVMQKNFFRGRKGGKIHAAGARLPCGKVALYGFQAVEKC